jgi:hypothetical protein
MSSARPLVHGAFSESPLPDMTLQQGELLDYSLEREVSEEEWAAADAAGRGVTWKEVTLETLLACPAALSHISEAGFVYYVPAFICAALDHVARPAPSTDDLFCSTVFHLTHSETGYSLSRLKLFNAEQRAAVTAFLREAANAGGFTGGEARKGLHDYWLTPRASEPLVYVP